MKIYHHNDLDGRCAAAIAWRSGDCRRDQSCETIEVDYKDEIRVDLIQENEKIVIVDFSFKPEVMKKVCEKTKEIIWLDHHKTAFEYKYDCEIDGIRDEKWAGCELAWLYFAGEIEDMPNSVKLIGDRDKWAWKYPDTANFNQGIKLYDVSPKSDLWEDLLFKEKLSPKIIEDGKTCIKFRDNFCADYTKSYGFETEFAGYKAFAIGIYMFGSEAFGKRIKEYPLCLSFEFDGKKWIIGLYSETIDVSEIAKANGGGGHKGAAGFVVDSLPFKGI